MKKWFAILLSIVNNTDWKDDFLVIGRGLVIAGVATPALSKDADFLSGTITVTIGLALIAFARKEES